MWRVEPCFVQVQYVEPCFAQPAAVRAAAVRCHEHQLHEGRERAKRERERELLGRGAVAQQRVGAAPPDLGSCGRAAAPPGFM